MVRNLIRDIFRYGANLPGWRTNRKIIVFESDDWGSIRMPSLSVYRKFVNSGIDLISDDANRYNQYDTLASSKDLSALFDVLSSYKDINGRACVFTPVSLVANPDFQKIKQHGFKEYFYEPFTVTLKKYKGCENSFELWKQGITAGVFKPQFHGREHLNVTSWMNALNNNHEETLQAFDSEFWSIRKPSDKRARGYQAAFHIDRMEELDYLKNVLREGLDLFEQLFHYKASYFVPTNGFFNNQLEDILAKKEIHLINTSYIQVEPLGGNQYQRNLHYLGQRNKNNQIYITRNCYFEPSMPDHDAVNTCLKQIKIAFDWRKPAIISTHRVNFIGSLNEANRANGLKKLNKLLEVIKMRWPDVEFLTTTELGDLIVKGEKN